MRGYEESYFCVSFVLFNVHFCESIVKSPQEQCVDAHMRVWELTPWKEEGNKKKKYMEKSRKLQKI